MNIFVKLIVGLSFLVTAIGLLAAIGLIVGLLAAPKSFWNTLHNRFRVWSKGLFVLLPLLSLTCKSATYYVDLDAGSDAANGTSTGTAWRTIPGTRTTDGTGYLNAAWGPFDTVTKVPNGTIIQIKAGTTHTSAAGGYVWIGRDYYAETGATFTIQSDNSWGTGSTATLDGTGMTIGIALMLQQVDGVTFKNLVIQDSDVEGLEAKEHQGTGNPLLNSSYLNLSFYNNGISYVDDAAGAGAGQLSLRYPNTCIVSNCTFNGNNRFINGLLTGDDHKYPTAATAVSCVSTNHRGSFIGNDCGIGFKCFNAQITYTNCISAFNLKGWDSGEQHGDNNNINVKVISCTASNNSEGINYNSSADPTYAGSVNFYLINSLMRGNTNKGSRTYAGPFNLYVVNNVFDANGGGDALEGCNLHITPDTATETSVIRAYIFNNIFLTSSGGSQLFVPYSTTTNNFTITSDWNSYQQRASELFARWAYYGGQSADFSYGANGPGHASGNWYSWYGNDTNALPAGTGHFHADANSKGTGCTVTNLPSLTSAYFPTGSYLGSNLSGQSWFITEMGVDRAGRSRVSWDMGAYEYSTGVVPGTGQQRRRMVLASPYAGADLSAKPWYIAQMGVDRAGIVRKSWDMGNFEFASPPEKFKLLLVTQ